MILLLAEESVVDPDEEVLGDEEADGGVGGGVSNLPLAQTTAPIAHTDAEILRDRVTWKSGKQIGKSDFDANYAQREKRPDYLYLQFNCTKNQQVLCAFSRSGLS